MWRRATSPTCEVIKSPEARNEAIDLPHLYYPLRFHPIVIYSMQ
jgi:hypothetical protein